MAVTHRPMASAWWLGGVLAANLLGAGVDPLVAAAGAVVAPVFGAGRLSPDADVTWLRRLGHRQATHRPDTTATVLTVITLVAWIPALVYLPGDAAWLVWAPITGWWSHLVGDSIFGRIPVGARLGRVLAAVLPEHLIRRGGGRQAYWVGLGWDTDGPIERGKLYVSKLPRWARWATRKPERTAAGLHTTVRVLPFAPTTGLLTIATVVLMAAVSVQWLRAVS